MLILDRFEMQQCLIPPRGGLRARPDARREQRTGTDRESHGSQGELHGAP